MGYAITDVEKLTEDQAREMSERFLQYKGHNIYFVTFEGGFGYSYLVFKDGAHIYYANDYALHHNNRSRDELDKWYNDSIKAKLFDDNDFEKDITSYEDYRKKMEYLTNYYMMRVPYISAFNIFHNDEEEKAFEKSIKNMTYDPVGFGYVKDSSFVEKHKELYKRLMENYNRKLNDYDYLKSMIIYEMGNHEYQFNNWQGNWDVITACFGDTQYDECDNYNVYFNQLKLNETQRKAFVDARREYLATCEC